MSDRQNNFFQCSLLAALAVIILLLGVIVIGVLYYNNGFDTLRGIVVQTTPTKTYVPFNPNATPYPYIESPKVRSERILFKSTWENEIYLILADGTNLTKVTNDGKTKSCPEWHPGGDKFIYAIPDPENPDRFIVIEQTMPGGQTKELFGGRTSEYSRTPKYSPDGSMLAYIGNDESGVPHVYVFDGKESKRISLNDGPERTFSWSWDGQAVAYEFYVEGKWFYSISTIDGIQHWMLSLVETEEDSLYPAAWAPTPLVHGQRYIVFTDINGLGISEIHIDRFDLDHTDMFGAVDARKALNIILNRKDSAVRAPVWAPQGHFLAYTTGKTDGCRDVLAVYMGPGEIFKNMSDDLCVDETFPMSWSPDGNYLVAAGDTQQQNWNLYILDLEEHEPFQLTNSERRDACPTWAPK
jgi:Tol biopolymer transport system component